MHALATVLPEGIDPPSEIPPEVFSTALATYLDGRRLDMGKLAAELGVTRSTLWRRIGGRDRLLGEILWYRTRLALAEALVAAGDRRGTERVLFVTEHLMRRVSTQPPLSGLLEREPEAALRILTSKDGPVQANLVAALVRLLEDERDRGMTLAIAPEPLAYAIVRLGESFLYADAIADHEPDVDAAVDIIASVLLGHAIDVRDAKI